MPESTSEVSIHWFDFSLVPLRTQVSAPCGRPFKLWDRPHTHPHTSFYFSFFFRLNTYSPFHSSSHKVHTCPCHAHCAAAITVRGLLSRTQAWAGRRGTQVASPPGEAEGWYGALSNMGQPMSKHCWWRGWTRRKGRKKGRRERRKRRQNKERQMKRREKERGGRERLNRSRHPPRSNF